MCDSLMTYITVQLFLKSTVDLSKLSDLIISQPEVSTVIKVWHHILVCAPDTTGNAKV